MCSCSEFEDLEFLRKLISERIKQSRSLKESLELVIDNPDGEHKLYRCQVCHQFWQGSRAWNWGNDEYLFCVPGIFADEWLSNVYVQPDVLLIFVASIKDFFSRNDFSETAVACRVEGCEVSAVTGLARCLRHHVQSLQKGRMLPANPDGRWFGPYESARILPDYDSIQRM